MAPRRLLPALLTVVAVAAAGCGHDDQSGAPGAPLAAGYVAIEITAGGEPRPLLPGTEIVVGFEGDRLSAELGCGRLTGRHSFERTRLVLADVEQQHDACDPPGQEQARSLAEFLTSRPQMLVSGDEAVINDGFTAIVLRDRDVPVPDEPLLRTAWELDGGDAGTETLAGTARLVLGLDGTITGEAPCGPLAAEALGYELDGDRLALTGTEGGPPCPDVEEAQRYARLLAPAMTWDVAGDRLTLRADDGSTATFRAAAG